MQNNPLKLKIAYLYPDILQGFCDEANVETFCKRACEREIEVTVHKITAHSKIQSSKYDFYYLGGSNYNNIETALNSLVDNKNELYAAINAGVPFLAVNCGYVLLSSSFQPLNKTTLKGLCVFNAQTKVSKNHIFGNIQGDCSFLRKSSIVGFQDHKILTYLNEDAKPFLILKEDYGNNFEDKTEGAKFKNAIGTYICGPLLAQNPHLCDFFIMQALKTKYRCEISLSSLCDDIEWFSHNYLSDIK